jgi:two-component system chemotaxis sensor kinase CheA
MTDIPANADFTLPDRAAANLELGHAIDAMTRQIRELQESVMAIRAQSVKGVFSRMTRLMRDLAQQLGKEVRAEISGAHTEVDSTVINELAEPLIHILRNAMDHGIEPPEDREQAGKPRRGTISISARQRGEQVVISVADDGIGIDRERVLAKAAEPGTALAPEEIDQLVFHPGLTTAEAVTNLSGRGVGLDVVRRNIGALGGRLTLKNRPGDGMVALLDLNRLFPGPA